MKKIIVTVVTAILLVGSSLSVNAAGLRDIFSAKYYADQYPDLKAAFGYDEEMLYQHFLDYGLKEGRNMSPILDVQEYREKYTDLDAAFGDNWDAYVEHFFDYGINENRDNGTNFDVKTYIEAYDDIEEAFGNDFSAVVEHYLTYGMEENRTMGDPEVYQAVQQPQTPQAPSQGGDVDSGDDSEEPGTGTEESGKDDNKIYLPDGSYYIDIYDEEGIKIRQEWYDSTDILTASQEYIYLEEGLIKRIYKNAEGIVEHIYVDDGVNTIESVNYNADGSLRDTQYFTYDENGKLCIEKVVLPDGSYKIIEWENDIRVCETYYSIDGTYSVCDYNEAGKCVLKENYNASGELTSSQEYTYDENNVLREYWWNVSGKLYRYVKYDAESNVLIEEQYSTSGELEQGYYNTYGTDGKLATQKEVIRNGVYSIKEYTNEVLIRKTAYNPGDIFDHYELYEYDSNGKCIRENWYNESDELINYYTNEYEGLDDGGYILTQKQYYADGTMLAYIVAECYSNGLWKSSHKYEPDGTLIW